MAAGLQKIMPLRLNPCNPVQTRKGLASTPSLLWDLPFASYATICAISLTNTKRSRARVAECRNSYAW